MPADVQIPQTSSAFEEGDINIKELLDVLMQHRWLGISTGMCVLLAGIFYLFIATPIYRADALVQIEQNKSSFPGMGAISEAFGGGNAQAQTQIEVIKSRSVLNRVVGELELDLIAEPIYFPLIGKALIRTGLGRGFRSVFPSYAWGGEKVEVSRFEVPDQFKGKQFVLSMITEGEFELSDNDGNKVLTGVIGNAADAEYKGLKISLFVRSLHAEPGVGFQIVSRRVPQVIRGLQANLSVSERRKQTGIIALTYESPDPNRAMKVLSSVINNYVRQNVEVRSEQASKSLEFLEDQLPQIQQQVADAEAALQSFKSEHSSVLDLSVEGQSILQQATQLEMRISEFKMQRSELRTRFTEESTAIKTLDTKLAQLTRSKNEMEARLKKMPQTELLTIQLMRNVQVANELYIQLLNRAQEFKVAKAGTVGDARILDAPVFPWKPDEPKKLLILAAVIMMALASGLLVIFLRRLLYTKLETPELIETELGLSVFSTIPHSKAEMENQKGALKGGKRALLCKYNASDPAIESLRSLRTSLQFALPEAMNNVVSIHGPTPAVGKSFVASNLAYLLGDTEKSVLLIDGDMRKGHIHKYLNVPRSPGLSEILAGKGGLDNVIHGGESSLVKFLGTGKLPPNPAELLAHKNFQSLLMEAAKCYDLVIIDTPPTLNLADSIAIGKLSGINFIVVRGGISSLQDLRLAQRRMEQNGINVNGVIFNDLSSVSSRYNYGGYYSNSYNSD